MKVKNTVIKNIYYMLTYAFQVLNQKNYEEVASESFDDIYNLFSAILIKGVNKQVKQGLYKEYVYRHENLPTIRGKINMKDTLKNKMERKQLIASEYDELSEDNIFNQIIKTTIILLLKMESVEHDQKILLKKILIHFSKISSLNPKNIQWKTLSFQRHNQTYQMLINICFFIINGLLLTTEKGEYKSHMFSEENMNLLFERFVLNYYKTHYNELDVHAPHIQWNVDEDFSQRDEVFLPRMETDIVLKSESGVLVIDTKFYSTPMTKNDKLNSNNLYQIFSYVKNMDKNRTGTVSGILLYAQTEADIYPDFVYSMDGNRIGAKTLNLNKNFDEIKYQLNQLIQEPLVLEI